MARTVVKDGTKYSVIGSEKCRGYTVFNVVEVGKEYYCADVTMNRINRLWYVTFSRCLNSGEWYDKVLYEYKDVPVYLMPDRPYEDKVRSYGMSFRSAVKYMWKVMKCFNTKKYLEKEEV